ncbi:hypothetical protein [Parasedimentitalea psychrophila]|uniref:Lipoprotein n=1 Tax=Parasedimentitalea psychrophila TaxID=2997337 RepID=A0A9Y2P180_9RHOB|nr:hypothetical protein [Parasedimentitalea psychrophila]WIY23867.1 hypothetical protein QPJ95_14600 [Parasedimentitalea psychrophila]
MTLHHARIFTVRSLLRSTALAGLAVLAGCAGTPGPSVPFQQGHSLDAAKAAVITCSPNAKRGGNTAVVSSYVGGIIFAGILGPLIVYPVQEDIRDSGEASAVDRCLADLGYERRKLTAEEVRVLNLTYGEQRRVLLDHLVAGGSLDTYGSAGV